MYFEKLVNMAWLTCNIVRLGVLMMWLEVVFHQVVEQGLDVHIVIVVQVVVSMDCWSRSVISNCSSAMTLINQSYDSRWDSWTWLAAADKRSRGNCGIILRWGVTWSAGGKDALDVYMKEAQREKTVSKWCSLWFRSCRTVFLLTLLFDSVSGFPMYLNQTPITDWSFNQTCLK